MKTRDKFIDRHCHFPEYNRDKFASDLDELLKKRAVTFAQRSDGGKLGIKYYQIEYDTFIKEQ